MAGISSWYVVEKDTRDGLCKFYYEAHDGPYSKDRAEELANNLNEIEAIKRRLMRENHQVPSKIIEWDLIPEAVLIAAEPEIALDYYRIAKGLYEKQKAKKN